MTASRFTFDTLAGVDFSCNPSRRKPVTVAIGAARGAVLTLLALEAHATLAGFAAWLGTPGPWLAAFDFPFGLPRAFVDAHRLGARCDDVLRAVRTRWPTRLQWRAAIDAWGNAQPPGQRLPHRRTDTARPGFASTSPLQTRYVPVGFMYYEGVALLLDAGVTLPRLHAGDPLRIALEGYPGLLARELIARRPYKNRNEPERLAARLALLDLLERGHGRLGVRLQLTDAQRDHVTDDPSGDRLDAVLCLVQAAWAAAQPAFGLPDGIDPVEGWIATV